MENRRTIIYLTLIVVGGLLIAIPFLVYGYDEKTTHPALTQEIVKFFNRSFPRQQISNEDAELITKGSIEEDKFGRWMRHFYDPINNKGLNYFGTDWQSSKEWAKDTIAQATYKIQDLPNRTLYGSLKDRFGGETDFSWERGIYEYAWRDKNRGLESLGHFLHLLEDASVPDHTRNDPHPGAGGVLKNKLEGLTSDKIISLLEENHDMNSSPYEVFAARFDKTSIAVADNLQNEKPATISSPEEAIEKMALYSNQNFFSRDTISRIYPEPKISTEKVEKSKNGKNHVFGYATNHKHRLVKIDKRFGDNENEYSIIDPDNLILSDYWSLLSKQAVLNGAGVVKLFFDEVANERKTKALYNKNSSWLTKKIDNFKDKAFGLAGIFYGSSLKNRNLDELLDEMEAKSAPQQKTASLQSVLTAPQLKKENIPTRQIIQTQSAPKTNPPANPANIISPSLPKPSSQQNKSTNTSSAVPIAGAGGGSVSGASYNNPSDTNPSPPPPSQPPPPPPTPPPILPSIILNIADCANSLSPDTCLLATSTVYISWSSTSSDLNYYTIECEKSGFICAGFPSLATTTATSTPYTLPENGSTYIFKAKAVDTNNNQSGQKTQTVEFVTSPVVINEIAWAGTSATRFTDEWIELYNPTARTINLASTTLVSETDNGPSIELSGILAAKTYYIIERGSDNAVSDIAASFVSDFGNGLNNSGETLVLKKDNLVFDRTPAVAVCGGWCGGANAGSYPTMERYDPQAGGENQTNWSSFAGLLATGKNADNINIAGTPDRRNSINYFLDASGSYLNSNKILKESASPYIVPSVEFTVADGATLTIEPGTVIKFYNTSSALKINGTLNAQGTTDSPIVFTSFKDDSYGGDTNADGAISVPQAGDWEGIKILDGGPGNSVLEKTIIRYGGYKDFLSNWQAGLRVENASTTIRNSTIEKSGSYGLWFKNSSGTIETNTIRDNNINNNTESAGILIEGGSPVVSGNALLNNSYGLRVTSGATSTIANNTFTGNTFFAAQTIGAYPNFSGSTAGGNGTNGINLQGSVDQNYTLASDLPYIIQNTTYYIDSGKTLTINPGVIIKLQGSGALSANGQVQAIGTPSSKVVFTSIYDDTYGGDTNADGAASQPQAGNWLNLTFNSGAASSTLNNVVVRYGGDTSPFFFNDGALRLLDTSIDVLNSTIEKNYLYGIWTQNSTSTTISDSLIQNHSDSTPEIFYGLYLTSSSTPTIANTTFRLNETHIFTDGTSSYTNGGDLVFE